MKKIALPLLLVAASAQAAESTLTVKTVSGDQVEVTATELLKALNGAQRVSQNFASASVNDDGTVSLLQPKVKFAGYNYAIAFKEYDENNYSSQEGICQLYGFSDASASPTYYGSSSITPAVLINANGRVERRVETQTEISSATCVDHLPDDSGL